MRAQMHLERIHLPRLRGFWRIVAAALIPGLAFHWRGPRWVARLIWTAFPLFLITFVVGLGTPAAEAAFALMIAAHVTSASHLLRPLMIRHRLPWQIVFGALLFVAVSAILYIPARNAFHHHVALAVTAHGHTRIMNPHPDIARIKRGDHVAYHIDRQSGTRVNVQAGLGMGAVLAVPGDHVAFGAGVISVNGVPQPQPGSSADWGNLIVPEECWFIWPDLGIVNRGVGGEELRRALRRLALVGHDTLVARQYDWWFWRSHG
jgi:hypothetical protein